MDLADWRKVIGWARMGPLDVQEMMEISIAHLIPTLNCYISLPPIYTILCLPRAFSISPNLLRRLSDSVSLINFFLAAEYHWNEWKSAGFVNESGGSSAFAVAVAYQPQCCNASEIGPSNVAGHRRTSSESRLSALREEAEQYNGHQLQAQQQHHVNTEGDLRAG
jgi:hypothetical protein